MRQKINIITLGVSDFKKSLNFYKDKLGWKTSPASQDDIAFFPMGGIVFAIYPFDLLAKDAGVKAEKKGFGGITLSYNAKSEEEVDKVLKTAEKAGAKIQKKAQKVFWGGYSGYFKDPDGYLWEVAHHPFFTFDKNDNLAI
jgi:uncharacterized protein